MQQKAADEDIDLERDQLRPMQQCARHPERAKKRVRLTDTTAQEGEEEGSIAVGVVGNVGEKLQTGDNWKAM